MAFLRRHYGNPEVAQASGWLAILGANVLSLLGVVVLAAGVVGIVAPPGTDSSERFDGASGGNETTPVTFPDEESPVVSTTPTTRGADDQGEPPPTTTTTLRTPRTTTLSPPTTTTPPLPQTTAPRPSPPPASVQEQQGSLGADTFLNPHNASGKGARVEPYEWVAVSCRVYAPEIPSANPDGWWYRLAGPPWANNYYVVANTFWNGDVPGQPPYTHHTDFDVPVC